jgi:hypothetical protein
MFNVECDHEKLTSLSTSFVFTNRAKGGCRDMFACGKVFISWIRRKLYGRLRTGPLRCACRRISSLVAFVSPPYLTNRNARGVDHDVNIIEPPLS